MIIQQSKAMFATSVTDNLFLKRQTVAPLVEKTADTTTISQAAQERLAVENASDLNSHTTVLYRVEGPVYSIEDMVKSKGRPLIAVKMT